MINIEPRQANVFVTEEKGTGYLEAFQAVSDLYEIGIGFDEWVPVPHPEQADRIIGYTCVDDYGACYNLFVTPVFAGALLNIMCDDFFVGVVKVNDLGQVEDFRFND